MYYTMNALKLFFLISICVADFANVASQLHHIMDCKRSKYGCCPDGVTDSNGWNHKGCSQLLCYDKDKLCKQMKKNGDCKSIEKWADMSDLCSKTCGRCYHGIKAAAAPACYKSKYGCCYDGVTAAVSEDKRPGVGCPFCHNVYKHPCKEFGKRHWCRGKWPRVRRFLKTYCYKQCGMCINFREIERPKETPGWRKKFY